MPDEAAAICIRVHVASFPELKYRPSSVSLQ
jgi:hypothetical protein